MKGVSEGSIAKSSSGVDFTKTLRKALMRADPKKVQKKYSQAISLFALLGSVWVKASSKMLVKLTPGRLFQNVSHQQSKTIILESLLTTFE